MIPNRSIGLCIVLTLITCGLYGIYWFICLTNELNYASKSNATDGGMSFILTFITCGIYGYFWAYQQGEKVDRMNQQKSATAIVYMLLQIFHLGIIGCCLMQNELNFFSDGQRAKGF